MAGAAEQDEHVKRGVAVGQRPDAVEEGAERIGHAAGEQRKRREFLPYLTIMRQEE